MVPIYMPYPLVSTLIFGIFFGCATPNNPKLAPKSDLDILVAREKSLVELRVGKRFCQGTLIKPNRVLTTAGCVNSGQQIIVRSYQDPAHETEGTVISSLPDEYAVIETAEPLEGTPYNSTQVKTGNKEPIYFFKIENRQWYLLDLEADQDFNRQGYRPGTAIFDRAGHLVGQQSFGSTLVIPNKFEIFVTDAKSSNIREPRLLDDGLLSVYIDFVLSAIRDEKGLVSGNYRTGIGSKYQLRRWELGLGLYGMGKLTGPGIHAAYRYEWVQSFDSNSLVLQPILGFLRYPYMGLGLEYGKFSCQLRYYKTNGSDLSEFLWNPLSMFF